MEILVKTMAGLEPVLAEEIKSLGGEDIEIKKRAVKTVGGHDLIYRLNYQCRTALRVLLHVDKFSFHSTDDFYKKIRRIKWSEYLDNTGTFAIDSLVSDSPGFKNSMFASLKAKDAIADQFRDSTGTRPSVDTNYPDLRVNLYIFKDECSVSIDSSGTSLHLRGYRDATMKAPLNEVLAAGLLMLTEWNGEKPLLDPMCGSGTFLVEAGMMKRNIPPGFFRKEFGFERWKMFKKEVFEDILDRARKNINDEEFQGLITGFDSASRSIESAKSNLTSAGLRKYIDVFKQDFFEADAPFNDGMLIMNPPYGERLDKDDLTSLYKSIGDTLKSRYKGCSAWILTTGAESIKSIGLRSSRKITVFNGPIECKFLKFEMYEGSKKQK